MCECYDVRLVHKPSFLALSCLLISSQNVDVCTGCDKHGVVCLYSQGDCPLYAQGDCPLYAQGDCPLYAQGVCPMCAQGECLLCTQGDCTL